MTKPGAFDPAHAYGALFTAVQMGGVFPDSKTFVDAVPRTDPNDIAARYLAERDTPGFHLAAFVATHFLLPDDPAPASAPGPGGDPHRYLHAMWDHLARPADPPEARGTLIPLPHPYVVPGGRFREIYYWDSYFTMLGLAVSGKHDLIGHMVANFAYLIDRIGFVPNGNRSYYCTRSQPPLFAPMVALLAEVTGDDAVYRRYLPQLEAEYAFWTAGREAAGEGRPHRRVAVLGEHLVNRYWDDDDGPRRESHREDVALAASSARPAHTLYRDIRAACESGWDFSSRWFADPAVFTSIETTRVLPVDLNALLYKLEAVTAHAHHLAGNAREAARFEAAAARRKTLIQTRFFDAERGFFTDLSLDGRPRPTLSLAGAYPLYFGLATPEQARRTADHLQTAFLKRGGYVTTLNRTGQQWDTPNGWAPLQWIVTAGLTRYGHHEAAEEGKRRWVANNLGVFQATGRMLEKYDVDTLGAFAGGGEYAVQDGFGWTNAVLLRFLADLNP